MDKITVPDEPDLRDRKYPAIIHFNADIKVKFKMMVTVYGSIIQFIYYPFHLTAFSSIVPFAS